MTVRYTSGIVTAVAKMADEDPETAQLFVQLSLFNTMADLIEQAGPVLEADTNRLVEQGAAVAKRQLLEISKSMSGPDIEDAALAVMVLDAYVVRKSLIGDALRSFNEKHPRGEAGRFVKVPVEFSEHYGQSGGERHTASHEQIKAKVEDLKNNNLIDDKTTLKVHYKTVDDQGNLVSGPDEEEAIVPTTRAALSNTLRNVTAAPGGDKRMAYAVSFDRRGIPGLGEDEPGMQRRAALDAMMTFTSPERVGGAARIAQSLPLDKDQTQNAAEWNRPGEWNDRKVYRRMQLTGQALSAATVPASTANTVGHLARLTGQLGPEAEKVLGPGVRRTAYRYRGTERRPRPELIKQTQLATRVSNDMMSGDPQLQAPFDTDVAGKQKVTPYFGSAAHWWQRQDSDIPPMTPDQLWLYTHGDTAAIGLVNEHFLPDLNAAALSLKAGEQPPSVGVIIDANGDLVTQAQGFNGDHYLPFDLKNLKELQGGQYVRTRAAGGLTSEDLYTGLLTGARQVQVVSNSGVFTLEFDPDVRGAKRYTDKALRMINRYNKILETIESGQIVLTDVDPKRRDELRAEARRIAPSKDKINETFNNLLEEERTNQEAPDEDEIYNEAAAQVDQAIRNGKQMSSQGRAREIDSVSRELMGEFRDKQVKRLALDGAGYGAAMAALQQEFPFFIRRAMYEPLPEFMETRGQEPQGVKRGPKDAGFVERGQTNPRRATGAPRYSLGKPESVGDKGAVQERQAAATGAKPVSAGTPLRRGEKEVKPLAEAVREPKMARATANKVSKLIKPLVAWSKQEEIVSPDAFRSTEDAMAEGGARLLWYQLIAKYRNDSTKFADWLLTESTPEQRKLIHDGLDDIENTMKDEDDDNVRTMTGLSFTDWSSDVIADLKVITDAVGPFEAPTAGDGWITARANPDHPRPQAVPQIVMLGDDAEAYDKFLSRPGTDPELRTVIEGTRNQTPAEHRGEVEQMLDELDEEIPGSNPAIRKHKIVENRQTAWAWHVGKDIAENLEQLGGASASGASPKEPTAKRDQPTFAQSVIALAESLHRSESQ